MLLLKLLEKIPSLKFFKALNFVTPGALFIAAISLAILILWDTVLTKKHKIFGMINGPLVVVVLGIVMFNLYQNRVLDFSLNEKQVVAIPVPSSITGFFSQFTLPDFSAITNFEVWKIAIVLAIVASLETLLCVEATEKMDPDKRRRKEEGNKTCFGISQNELNNSC